LPERILQFGGGNFLRAFADWMVDVANRQGVINGRIVVVQSVSRDRGRTVEEQDGYYTVLTRGMRGGVVVDAPEVVTSVSRSLVATDPAQWAEVLRIAASPELRVVLSNTTEAGIVFVPEPLVADAAPTSYPGKLCAVLLERFRRLGSQARGLIVLPCELIERNGQQLREAVLKTAAHWQLPAEFIAWLDAGTVFCDTLVDRIVPGGAGADADTIAARLGYDDRLLTVAEPYHVWVITAPESVRHELPFDRVGLNVVWSDDLPAWRTKKVRVLNGAHTAMAMLGHLAGATTVIEVMRDAELAALVSRLLVREVAPTLPADPGNAAYVTAITERFANPFLKHELLAISLNSVAKWKVRLLPTLKDALAAGRPAPLIVASLAGLILFYRGVLVDGKELAGQCAGRPYAIKDDSAVLATFAARWAAYDRTGDLAGLVDETLGDVGLWGADLRMLGIAAEVAARLHALLTMGARAVVTDLLKETA
jgi:tagaturonate reductase